MASSKEYLDFILDQLSDLDGITYKRMMGEYIIYYNEKIVCYICDDRLLAKDIKQARDFIKDYTLEKPYPNGKEMILVEDVDNRQFLCDLFNEMFEYLEYPKKRKKKI